MIYRRFIDGDEYAYYCRFVDGDVYACPCDGGVQFWVTDEALNRLCKSCVEAYQYAKDLRDVHGIIVPDHAIEELREDVIDEVNEVLRMAENAIGIHPQAEVRPQSDEEALRRQNRNLKDENERLRSCLSDDAENARLIMGENADLCKQLNHSDEINGRLVAENAKLRELVAEMFNCVKDGNDCEKCRESNDGYACSYVMRELGIEVD